jgi:hypothetical protein
MGAGNLYIWVEDAEWTTTGEAGKVSQIMVDALADKFYKDGSTNIYDLVTNICGKPWGDHSMSVFSSSLINATDDVHILLTDIDGDDSSTGGVVGYYFPRDNFKSTSSSKYASSNEKIMFYIDSVLFANKDDSSWEITDSWPKEIVATLAHEFQHMIIFYQKTIKNNLTSGTESWLNELASMAIEDLVASHMQADGPRGVTYSDETAGSANNQSGRLPLYNYNNNTVLTTWSGALKNYSINYAFGAYLIRNFGGAKFLQNLVQNNKIGYEAITTALSSTGYSQYNFDLVLKRFGTANLLSNFTNAPDSFKLNNGTWFSSTEGSTTYTLGSINLYNYLYQAGSISQTGPFIYGVTYKLGSALLPTSNTYYRAMHNVNGTESISISGLDDDVKVSVIIK